MTETPEFSGCPELYISRGLRGLRALAEVDVANELMWVVAELVAELVDRINA